jgi:hypothetical protein
VFSAWVDSAWYYRRGWTVHGVIWRGWTVSVLLAWVLPAWVDGKWCYRAWVDGRFVFGVGGQCMVLSAWVDNA